MIPCSDINLQINHVKRAKNTIADFLTRVYSSMNINHQLLQYIKNHYHWDQVQTEGINLNLHVYFRLH